MPKHHKHHQPQKFAAVSAPISQQSSRAINGPTPTLAIAALRERLTLLQHAFKSPEYAALRQVQVEMSALCDAMHRTISDGIYQLAQSDDGLQGLLDLLEKAGSARIAADRLLCLLAPLQRQRYRTRNDIGQLL